MCLCERVQFCLLDNRGVGGSSDPPTLAWTMEDMASDVLALLDTLGWGHVHVVRCCLLYVAWGYAWDDTACMCVYFSPICSVWCLHGRYDCPAPVTAARRSVEVIDVGASELCCCVKRREPRLITPTPTPRLVVTHAGGRYASAPLKGIRILLQYAIELL